MFSIHCFYDSIGINTSDNSFLLRMTRPVYLKMTIEAWWRSQITFANGRRDIVFQKMCLF